MKILVTGHRGFIGSNLMVRLPESSEFDVTGVGRDTPGAELDAAVATADVIVHLAGVNRPEDPADFGRGNTGFTKALAEAARRSGRAPAVIFASSTQAALDNAYGVSKREAEDALRQYADDTGAPVHIFRLPNVFGKWCRPNYNSAVATFCHNITRGLPIRIDDPDRRLTLVYVDDVIDAWMALFGATTNAATAIAPTYDIAVGELAAKLRSFESVRSDFVTERVGAGLDRALYATYVSYLPPPAFAYPLPMHADARGVFVEFLKTRDSGQFSFFIAKPGVTRGGHYHHSKTEKFLVVQGRALFRFRQIVTNEVHEITADGSTSQVVETVPGWAHDITNVGSDDLIVMLWANEVFDRNRPDTVASRTL